jgi:hypothetical protein
MMLSCSPGQVSCFLVDVGLVVAVGLAVDVGFIVDVGFAVAVGLAIARVICIRHIDGNLDRRRSGILVVVVFEIAVR